MPVLDYLTILLFTLLVLVVGMVFTRSGASMKSYFAAGGALPWWLSGLSLFMSFFSAGTFVVWGSIAYEYGWVAISIQWMMGLSGFLIAMFIAPRWKKANILTVGQYIGDRFGPGLRKFYSYIFLLLSFFTTGAFLYPVAKLFNVSTGFSIEVSIILLGLLVIAYTAAGGLWAVIVTDVLQFVILFAAVLIVVPLAVDKIGGLEAIGDKSPEGFFQLINGEYTAEFLLAFLLYNTIFIGGNWAYVQRYTSVATTKDARKVGWLFGVLYLVSPVLWMLPPMIFRGLGTNLTGLENEGAFLLMCKEVLPIGLLGLMLGGMIFATASSVNTTLNMSAAVFTNDLYKKLKPDSSQKALLRVARISTIVFGLITIVVALMVPRFGGIVEVVLSVGAITGAPLFAPPIWSLFSKRQTAFSILCTTIISLLINLFFKFLSPALLDITLSRANEMLLGVFGPMLILMCFECYYAFRPAKQQSHLVEPQPTTSQDPEDAQQNRFALRVLGAALAITGFTILVLGMNATQGSVITISVGGLVLLLGLLIRYKKLTN